MANTKLKLSDLYVVGKVLTISDGPGREVTVWLQRLNPAEAEEAYKKAQAARSRVLTCKNDRDSDLFQSTWLQVLELGEDVDSLIEYVVEPERYLIEMMREAELSIEEDGEWSKDNYIVGLKEAWEESLQEKILEDPEDEEAKRVHAELQRFDAVLQERVTAELARVRAEYDDATLESVREKVHTSILDALGNMSWLQAYHKAEVYFGTRQIDMNRVKYFERYGEVEELPGPVLSQLMAGFESLPRIGVIEGKDLGETPSSSTPSEVQAEATVAPSGLATVSR